MQAVGSVAAYGLAARSRDAARVGVEEAARRSALYLCWRAQLAVALVCRRVPVVKE